MEKMIRRDKYLAQARMFAHDDIIIVVTGVRRCGKSTLLRMLREELQYNADSDDVFISANLENLDLNITTADDLYQYCMSRLGKNNNYIFLDEIQNVPNWHRVVNSLRIKPGCHIFLTGSNARLFSGSLATYLSGRYVEIEMQPLVFSEYLNFLGLSPSDNPQMLLDSHNAPLLTDAVLEQFLRWGGFPALAQSTVTQEQHEIYLQSIYDTVIERDIMMREHLRSLEGQPRGIKNADLLRTLCTFLADYVGNPCSYSSIARALKPAITTTDKTVANYINTKPTHHSQRTLTPNHICSNTPIKSSLTSRSYHSRARRLSPNATNGVQSAISVLTRICRKGQMTQQCLSGPSHLLVAAWPHSPIGFWSIRSAPNTDDATTHRSRNIRLYD